MQFISHPSTTTMDANYNLGNTQDQEMVFVERSKNMGNYYESEQKKRTKPVLNEPIPLSYSLLCRSKLSTQPMMTERFEQQQTRTSDPSYPKTAGNVEHQQKTLSTISYSGFPEGYDRTNQVFGESYGNPLLAATSNSHSIPSRTDGTPKRLRGNSKPQVSSFAGSPSILDPPPTSAHMSLSSKPSEHWSVPQTEIQILPHSRASNFPGPSQSRFPTYPLSGNSRFLGQPQTAGAVFPLSYSNSTVFPEFSAPLSKPSVSLRQTLIRPSITPSSEVWEFDGRSQHHRSILSNSVTQGPYGRTVISARSPLLSHSKPSGQQPNGNSALQTSRPRPAEALGRPSRTEAFGVPEANQPATTALRPPTSLGRQHNLAGIHRPWLSPEPFAQRHENVPSYSNQMPVQIFEQSSSITNTSFTPQIVQDHSATARQAYHVPSSMPGPSQSRTRKRKLSSARLPNPGPARICGMPPVLLQHEDGVFYVPTSFPDVFISAIQSPSYANTDQNQPRYSTQNPIFDPRNTERRSVYAHQAYGRSSNVKLMRKTNVIGTKVKKLWQCNQCENSFDKKSGLNIHKGKMHRDNILYSTIIECPECGKKIVGEENFFKHMIRNKK